MDLGTGLGHLPGHRTWENPWFSNINADTMSYLQQHKSNRGELSAINRGVGGWIKDKNKETHQKKKKVRKTGFFLSLLGATVPRKRMRVEK